MELSLSTLVAAWGSAEIFRYGYFSLKVCFATLIHSFNIRSLFGSCNFIGLATWFVHNTISDGLGKHQRLKPYGIAFV